jgi:hypothetical protein
MIPLLREQTSGGRTAVPEVTERELIEEIAFLRRELHRLTERERRLSDALAARMAESGLEQIESDRHTCKLVSGDRLKVNPARLFERVRREDFLAAVTVSVAEARRLMGEAELRSLSEAVPFRQLRVEPKRP